jgi:hypothetical protein
MSSPALPPDAKYSPHGSLGQDTQRWHRLNARVNMRGPSNDSNVGFGCVLSLSMRAAALALGVAKRKTAAVADPVVPHEYLAHVRHVTAELRELIPTVASVAAHARALLDADEFSTWANDLVPARPTAAADVADLADLVVVADLLRTLLNLSETPSDQVMVDLMRQLDRHVGR